MLRDARHVLEQWRLRSRALHLLLQPQDEVLGCRSPKGVEAGVEREECAQRGEDLVEDAWDL